LVCYDSPLGERSVALPDADSPLKTSVIAASLL
jgi:hypothetical protein